MHIRTSVAALAALSLVATAAGAATVHRFAVTSPSGSLGAQTYVQSSSTQGALQAEVSTSPDTTFSIPFASIGLYDPGSTTTFGIGVGGLSRTGYGVAGQAFGTSPAIIALGSGSGDGLDAFAKSNPAIVATSAGPGVVAKSTNADGVDATEASSTAANAVSAISTSPYGNAIYANAQGSASDAAFLVSDRGDGIYADSEYGHSTFGRSSVYAATSSLGTDLFQSSSSNGNLPQVESFEITSQSIDQTAAYQQPQVIEGGQVVGTSDVINNGDLYLAGGIFTGCTQLFPVNPSSCVGSPYASSDAVKTTTGQTLTAYATRNASPTMEDEGETRLTNGYVHVALDPAFASTISTSKPYLVFPAPMGDCRGLYVTNRSATGFDVRELAGGHSNVTFDYRIVAHPFANDAKRLAVVPRAAARTAGRVDSALAEHARLTAAAVRSAAAYKIATPHALLKN